MKNKKNKVTVEEMLHEEEPVEEEIDDKDEEREEDEGQDSVEEENATEENFETEVDDAEEASANEMENPEQEEIAQRYLRLQADFQNYKRRSEEEQKNTVRYANERLILQFLDVVDNFERALATEKEHDNFYLGMEMIHAQLREILEKNGVEAVVADGEAFDPNLHHAVLTEESAEVEEGHVIETLQTGYMLNGKLIRPAMVKVAK